MGRCAKYLVIYAEKCQPSIAIFKTKKKAKDFIYHFHIKYKSNTRDNWIDFIIKGNIEEGREGLESWVVKDL